MRYSATDPVWNDVNPQGNMVDLREHVRRLCLAAGELSLHPLGAGWDDVAHNLRLAYSLVDVFAETDVDGASMWCSPVAEYESTNGELTEKHLAATVVFTFAWTAYECAVELMMAPTSRWVGRGAMGRDLLATISAPVPFLRSVLLQAAELDHAGTNFSHPDMRRLLHRGSVPGIAGEYLRQFRNRLIHGKLPKPEPQDWGEPTEYIIDQDPHVRRFHANIRLVLLLLQALAAEDVDEDQEVEAWLEGPCDARLALQQLHCCDPPANAEAEPELEFGGPPQVLARALWG
jgi:hypothetical protein